VSSSHGAARVIASVTARLQNGHDLLGVATFSLTAGGTVTRRVTSVAGGLPWPGGPAVVRNLTAEEQRMFCGRGHRRRGRVYLADLAVWYGWTVVA
jgi:hypothetical protein